MQIYVDWRAVGVAALQILLSFTSFWLIQFVVRWYLFGQCTFRTFSYFGWDKNVVSSDQTADLTDIRSSQSLLVVPPNRQWRISNEAVSLLHSVISGFWALYAFICYPQLLDDMTHSKSLFAHYLIILSTGYLLHDVFDLLINECSLRIFELIFHHIIVLMAFSVNFVTQKFLGVVICGLLMELNSIFLHSRSLLNLYRVEKSSTAFRIIALLNIISFMIFRMAISIYLIYWQLSEVAQMAWHISLITLVIVFALFMTNTVLLYRVLAADGLLGKRWQRPQSKSSGPTHVVVATKTDETCTHLVATSDVQVE